jgi:phosphoribosylformylglycinamidine (FGAM) synthase-like enzyme
MSTFKLGCQIDLSEIKACGISNENAILFGEDQSRYVVAINSELVKDFRKNAEKKGINVFKVGEVIKEKISISSSSVEVRELVKINEAVFEKKFS